MRLRSARVLAPFGLLAALAGCASFEHAPGYEVPDDRWRAGVARRGADPAEVPNPMRADEAMRRAANDLGGKGADEERLRRLRAALLDPRAFTFEYERNATFSAADAFTGRRGNCVSFTNLFIALGRSLGIRVQAALFSTRNKSEKSGDLIVTYNHMVAVYPMPSGGLLRLYDFYGTNDEPSGGLTILDDWAVAAIRASNLGVAHLARGELAEAERDLETAVKLAPFLSSVHANLGLVRWRKGDVNGALEALRKGLEVEPGSPQVLQNLAAIYAEEGRTSEAHAALSALDETRASPYALIVRGDFAMRAGDHAAALKDYRKAASLDPKVVDAWLAVARAENARGRSKAAAKAAKKALALDPTSEEARRLAGAP